MNKMMRTDPAPKSFFVQAGSLLGMFLLMSVFFYIPAFSKISIVLGDGWSEYASAVFLKTWISRGIFPLWNPDVGFGLPDWISYSPLAFHQWLQFFLPSEVVWNLVKVLNFVLSGWLLSLYLLRRLNSLFPAFLGGLTISIAQLNVDIVFASYFLFMLSLLLADRMIDRKSFSSGLFFLIALFLFYISALPQPIICVSLFLFCYIAIRFRLHRSFNIRLCLLTLFPFVMVLMLFSPQIWRVKELLDLSCRANVADKEVFFIPPWEYLQLFWPNFIMTSQDTVLNVIPARMIVAVQNRFPILAGIGLGGFPHYGIFPFFAVLCLFLKRNLRSFERKLLMFLIFILFFPLLNPILYPITRHIPILGVASGSSLFGNVYSHILLLVVSILTALSLGYFADDRSVSEFHSDRIKIFFIGFAVFVVLASLVRLTIDAAFFWDSDRVRGVLDHWLASAFSSGQFRQPPDFYANRIAQASEFLRSWASPRNVYFSMPVFLILGSLAALYARLTQKIGKTVFFTACFALLLADAYAFHPMSFYDPKELTPLKEEADFIKRDQTIFRVMALQDNSPQAVDAATRDLRNSILRPETQLLYGLSSPECYRSLVIKDYNDYMSRMTVEGGARGRLVGEFGTLKDTALLDLANIKYLIAPVSKGTEAFPPEHYEHVYQTVFCNIFRNKLVKDRAFFLIPQNEAHSVVINEYSPHRVRLSVLTGIPNELVLSDQYYPGWNAYLDGTQTLITRYEGTFRKIAVPSGRHEIEFKFQPPYLSYGMILPLIALAAGIGILCCRK